jgi:hypothetical protein
MGLFDRLFGARSAKRSTTAPAAQSKSHELADMAVNLLMTQIDLGGGMPGGAHRSRLGEPYARGYLFGLPDALFQRGKVAGDTEALALITIVHVQLLGREHGAKFVGAALSDQADPEFARGRADGGADVYRWLSDGKVPPLMLSDYLNRADSPTGSG